MDVSFRYTILASPLHDEERLALATAGLVDEFIDRGGVAGSPTTTPDLPFVIVIGTGGTEAQVLEMFWARQTLSTGEPALLVAHESDNSLPAALEALARIQADGGRGTILRSSQPESIATAIRHQAVYLALQHTRLGVVGAPSDWLVASTVSEAAVRERWGPTLVDVATGPVIDHTKAACGTEVAVELGRRWTDAARSSEPADDEVARAAALHGPLVQLIADNNLDAITVRCFDLLDTTHTSGCVSLAELNDQGIVAGCEGDIASAVAMVWVRELFQTASWMANPSTVYPETGEIVLAHCTVAPSLVADYELSTHFESGLGIGVSGRFLFQPVTLVRLGGANLEKCWLVDGELIDNGDSPHLCRTQATVSIPEERAIELLERPLGNHVVLLPGHHAVELQRWWDLYIRQD